MSTHSDQNARVLDQFGKQAESYAALVRRSGDNTSLDPVLAALQPLSTDRMLDVGCGSGRFAIKMAPLVAHVTGVDLTDAMLDQARRAQAEAKIANVLWRQCDVTELPFDDATFDIVSSQAMLHHVASPSRVIAEMRRVCKPGGRIIVVDMTPKPSKAAALNAIEILRDPSHANAITNAELRAIGTDLGIPEIAVREYESRISLEAVLKTSFPDTVTLDRIRRLYRIDAESGSDALGMGAQIEDDQVVVAYPMSMVVWRREADASP
jgi:ubiquinone/menaquinone biosynthesis C-methylase UbiE